MAKVHVPRQDRCCPRSGSIAGFSENTIQTDDGTISYLDNNRQGQAIFFIHGFRLGKYIWENQFRFFDSLGFRVIACDIPGHGGSDPRKDISMGSLTKCLSFMEKSLGLEKTVFVGHSLGGMIVLNYMTQFAGPDNRAVLLSTSARLKANKLLRLNIFCGMFKLMRPLLMLIPESFLSPVSCLFIRNRLAFSHGFIDVIKKSRPDLSKMQGIPALIITGDADKTVPMKDSVRMHKMLPDSKLMIIKGGRHQLQYKNSEQVNSAISDFIKWS